MNQLKRILIPLFLLGTIILFAWHAYSRTIADSECAPGECDFARY